ncbi:hypothetical protein JST97_32915 [bacterium]|nr:hypothetical protein [bacterium]
MKRLLLLSAMLCLGSNARAQSRQEGEIQYSWSYCLSQDNRLGPEVVLNQKARLPGDARLFLRIKNGPSRVAAVVFNSSRGRMEPKELPLILTLDPNESKVSGWKRGSLSGSKTYLALLLSDSPESEQVKALRRDWQRAADQGQDCSQYAQKLYDQIVLWHSENKGGSALAGDIIQEVGAVRAGAAGRPVDSLPPGEAPPNWEASARSIHWKPAQHPVVISRFATRP